MQAELLKLQKSGQFPDEFVKIEGVLEITDIKEITLEGRLL